MKRSRRSEAYNKVPQNLRGSFCLGHPSDRLETLNLMLPGVRRFVTGWMMELPVEEARKLEENTQLEDITPVGLEPGHTNGSGHAEL